MTVHYIVGELTHYDSDDCLWYTKIGIDDKQMTLFCIVAGKTLLTSRSRAENLAELLNNLNKNEA